jgi:hypothetical protein
MARITATRHQDLRYSRKGQSRSITAVEVFHLLTTNTRHRQINCERHWFMLHANTSFAREVA